VAPDGGRRKAEAPAERHRALRTVFVQCSRHPVTGAVVVMARLGDACTRRLVDDHCGFHNDNVT
jgi:hypothetical protein